MKPGDDEMDGEMDGEPMFWNVASANGRRDEVDANVRLIAAAPDLLEALRNLLKVHEGEGGTTHHAGDIARAAIDKAEGKP